MLIMLLSPSCNPIFFTLSVQHQEREAPGVVFDMFWLRVFSYALMGALFSPFAQQYLQ